MASSAGGRLVMQYANGQKAYELALPIAPIAAMPSGPENDYLYVAGGGKMPLETGVLATFASFAAVWALYYDPAWVLSLLSVWRSSSLDSSMLAAAPIAADVLGVAAAGPALEPPLRRGFTFWSALGARQRVRFFEPSGNEAGAARIATATLGGFDVRDQLLVAYLSAPETGLVCWDGQPYPNNARVYVRFQHQRVVTGGGPLLGDYLVNG